MRLKFSSFAIQIARYLYFLDIKEPVKRRRIFFLLNLRDKFKKIIRRIKF